NVTEEANSPGVLAGIAAFKKIYVRDTTSQQRLARAGINAQFVPDLTLSWGSALRHDPQETLIITDSSDSWKTKKLLHVARQSSYANMRTISLRAPPPLVGRRYTFELKRALSRMMPRSPW